MKPNQDFSSVNLMWMRGKRLRRSALSSPPSSEADWKKLSNEIESSISAGTFAFTGLYLHSRSNRTLLSTRSPSDALVLRKINDNLRRAYGIRQPQRDDCIQLAARCLQEASTKSVIRLDFKSCFESIRPSIVLERLRSDARVSHTTISLLDRFLRSASGLRRNLYTRGLPRGVLTSSTLAEIYLQDFDHLVGKIEGIYAYIRYVDDVLIFATRPDNEILRPVNAIAESLGLTLNKDKSKSYFSGCNCGFGCKHGGITCPCERRCTCHPPRNSLIEFLGYSITFESGKALSAGNRPSLMLSRRKSGRIKERIRLAFSDFRLSKDFDLLSDRIRFITRNVEINHAIRGKTLLSGISFSHRQYDATPAHERQLAELTLSSNDHFLQRAIRKHLELGLLTPQRAADLRKNSFKMGFKRFHRAQFPATRMVAIRECWTNA